MSHREGRDSDSKRHRSRFDRESSPKRSRRDGKPALEREPGSNKLDNTSQSDQEQKHSRRLQDGIPLESPLTICSKQDREAPSKEPGRKPNGEHQGKKHSSSAAEVPRPRSHRQHDERSYAAQIGRSSDRGAAGERGWWRDSRDQCNERTGNKSAANDTWRRDDRAKGDEKGNWRHDGFFEMEAGAPPARKRPAFREKKIPVKDSENADRAATEAEKSTHPADESRNEERSRNGRHLGRSEKPFAGERVPNRREPYRSGFSSRERHSQSSSDGNYRGRDRYGGRPGFHSGGARVEKWKHDLYQESNRSPTPKNEEDQIAKVEELLAS